HVVAEEDARGELDAVAGGEDGVGPDERPRAAPLGVVPNRDAVEERAALDRCPADDPRPARRLARQLPRVPQVARIAVDVEAVRTRDRSPRRGGSGRRSRAGLPPVAEEMLAKRALEGEVVASGDALGMGMSLADQGSQAFGADIASWHRHLQGQTFTVLP